MLKKNPFDVFPPPHQQYLSPLGFIPGENTCQAGSRLCPQGSRAWFSSGPPQGYLRSCLHACVLFSVFSSSSLPSSPGSLLLTQVPSAPRRFRVRQPNLETINLEWDHPEHPNGILIGYTLKYVACMFCLFAFFFSSQSDVMANPFSPFSCGMEIGSLHALDGCRRHRGESTKEKFPVIKEGRQDPIPALLTQLLLQEGDKASSGPLRETIPTLRELVVSSIDKSKEESPSPTGIFILRADSVCTGIQGCSETL